jgi:two-component system, sensor histidine kinase and response regulator
MRILIAEDNPLNQKIIMAYLRSDKHEIVLAVNGRIAFEQFQVDNFDCILMDLHMPGMDGFEATKAIRETEKGATIPIIAVTASAPYEDKQKCFDAGMDDFLQKPIRHSDLKRVVNNVESGEYRNSINHESNK